MMGSGVALTKLCSGVRCSPAAKCPNEPCGLLRFFFFSHIFRGESGNLKHNYDLGSPNSFYRVEQFTEGGNKHILQV